jgi:glycogen(starch) synthase
MRILFWSLNFWPNIGGIEVLAAKFVPALRERGHEFLVVAPRTESDMPENMRYRGIPIRRFGFQNTTRPFGLDHLLALKREIGAVKRAFAPDLVHVNGAGPTNFFHLTTREAYRAPTLVTLHGEWDQQADGIVGQTLRAADWVAACSAAVLNRGLRVAPEIADRSAVIYNGVEVPPLAPQPLPFTPPRVLCLGRLSREKGMDLALACFSSVLERFPHARLVIAGDGPMKEQLQEQAVLHGIAHAVDLPGWIAPDQVPSLINTATLVVLPSRQDSMPLVALESALMARPIVATRVGGLPEVVAHEESGLLVESENAQALSRAIVSLLSHSEIARRMGENGRLRAGSVFSWERHVDAYDALYRSMAH